LVAIAFLLILFVASRPVRSPATPFAALACVGFAVTEGLRGRRDRAAAVLEGVSALVALGAIGYVFAHLPS
jgi:hypothetical protein